MSQIEDKHINWKIQNLVNEYCYCEDMKENNSGMGFTECCNYCHLGVVAHNQLKMARKEFIIFLMDLLNYPSYNQDTKISNKIDELKQSPEENKKYG